MRKFSVLFFLALFFACTPGNEKKNEGTGNNHLIARHVHIDTETSHTTVTQDSLVAIPTPSDTHYRIKITPQPSGYGYQVFYQGKMIINQPHIPAIQGLSGFATSEDARKVGEAVIEKLKKGIQPPSVTMDELKQMGVVK